jgi:hypothetical protein
MSRARLDRFALPAASVLFLLLSSLGLDAQANTIDYRSPDQLHTALYDRDGVTVTGGPGLVNVNLSNGLSVVGSNDFAVDAGEFLSFAFDAGAASGISFHINGGPTATTNIEAFGTGGSLGSQAVNLDVTSANTVDVSSLFANQLIAHFSVATTVGAYRLDILNFTPVSVPEPATFALLGLAFAGMGLARRRKLS